MRKRLAVICANVIVGLIVGAMAAPLQAEDKPDVFTLLAGSHSYVIPRDIIQMIMSNQGPVWVSVQLPQMTTPATQDQQTSANRTINVTFPMGRSMTVARHIEALNELKCSPDVSDAPYGLRELRSCFPKQIHEYIASPEGGAEYVMRCISYSCDYDFEYLDLPVNVSFNSKLLGDWRQIHQKALSLLDGLRQN